MATESLPLRVRDAGERTVPIEHVNITATSSGAAQTLYTCSASGATEVMKMTVTNKSGTAATLTFHSIPDGDSIGDVNKELDAFNIPANTALRVDGLLGGTYDPSTVFKVYSGTNGALVIRGAVRAIR